MGELVRQVRRPRPPGHGVKRLSVACLLSLLAGAGIGHALMPSDLATTPSASPSVTVEAPKITEDDWRWNCLTMGNKVCGPGWTFVDDELDSLLDDVEYPSTWQACITRNDGEVDLIVCGDGRPVVAL